MWIVSAFVHSWRVVKPLHLILCPEIRRPTQRPDNAQLALWAAFEVNSCHGGPFPFAAERSNSWRSGPLRSQHLDPGSACYQKHSLVTAVPGILTMFWPLLRNRQAQSEPAVSLEISWHFFVCDELSCL
jgi:hypothetical protein